MKSFKEFLMEEDSQDQDFEILNSLKDFLEKLKENNNEDISQEKIVKYLICRSLAEDTTKKDENKELFIIKDKDDNNELNNLKLKCVDFFKTNRKELEETFNNVDNYIKDKYGKQRTKFYLTKGEVKDVLDSDNTSFNGFLKQAEKKMEEKLTAAAAAVAEKTKKESPVGGGSIPPNDIEEGGDNPPPAKDDNGTNGDNPPHTKDDNGTNGGNNENYGTTRQGSYLGRFSSAQMEDIMSGNEDKIANALGVMAKAAKDRCDELLSQVKEKVEKNSKYLKEEEAAQKVLWEGIFNRLPKQEKLKVQKQHGTKSIYKDEDNQKLTEIINKYKAQIDSLVKTTVDNCQPLGEKLHAFSTSAKMEDKLKEQLRMNVRNFTNKLYDITLEVEKASRKSGFFENIKIEKEAKKEDEWNKFKNSDKGENFNRRLSEKTEAIKKELLKILPNIQKASNEAEVNIKLVSKLIKDSTNANDFFTKASSSKKIIENGRKISILDWLQKRGIPVPVNKEINDKYSKDLTVASWNELFKDKKFLNSLNGYGENFDNFKVAYDNLKNSRNLEDFEKLKKQFGEEFGAEINVFCKEFIELEKRQQKGNNGTVNNGGTVNNSKNNEINVSSNDDYHDNLYYGDKNKEDEDAKKTKKKLEDISKIDYNNWNMSVTTNSCDGLPIGARKYSKAVRRRMNYALNKYL